jgi:putative flippase GtrA
MRVESDTVPAFGVLHPQRYLSRVTKVAVWRLVRFGVMGVVTFGVQIGLLMLLKDAGLGAILAYAVGLAAAVQFNFAVNQLFVWDDRPITVLWSRAAFERWVTFHGCIAFSLVLNFGAFVVARWFMGDLPAAVVGVGVSTVVKFFSLDRLAFPEDAAVSQIEDTV